MLKSDRYPSEMKGERSPSEQSGKLWPALWCSLVLAAVLCLLYWDVVFGGFTLDSSTFMYGTTPKGPFGYEGPPLIRGFPVLDPGGSAWVEVPLTDLSRRILLSGHLPFWNPHNAAGMPLAADMVTAPFFPLKALFLLGTSAEMWDFYLLLRLFLAGLFTFLFLRSIGVSHLASMGAAFLYMFSGHATYHINMCPFNSELCLPGLLWASEKLIQTRSRTYALALALFVASVFLGGLPEAGFFVFLLVGFYALFRLIVEARVDFFGSCKALGLGVVGGIIGFCLAAPVTFPSIEFFQVGHHTHTMNMARISLMPEQLITFFVPFFYGKISYTWLRGLSSPAPYIGLVATLLAVVGLVAPGRNRGRAIFFAFCIILYFLRAFDVVGTRWMGLIPLYNKTIFPRYAGSILYFSVAVLGGLGLDAIVRKKRLNLYLLALLAAGICAFIIIYWLSTVKMLSSPQWWNAVSSKWLDVNLQQYIGLQITIALAFLIAASLVAFLAGTHLLHRRIAAVFLILLYLIEIHVYMSELERPRRYDPFAKPPIVDFLISDTEPFRMISTERAFFGETNAPFGIDEVRVLQALNYDRYEKFIQEFFGREMGVQEISTVQLASPIVNLLNLKYVVSTQRIDDQLPSNFKLVYNDEMVAYLNTNALPRAFVPSDVWVVHEGDEALKHLKLDTDRIGRGMVVVIEDPARPEKYIETNQVGSRADIVSYEPHKVCIKAFLRNDGLLVLLDSNYPGWKASVDGRETRIRPANYLFRGVWVSAGTHEIEFTYEPLSVKLGFVFFSLGLLCMLVLFTQILLYKTGWRRTEEKRLLSLSECR